MTRAEAVLVLEDGRHFIGEAFAAIGETTGEAVFTTAMTGYQETLTDPSYHRQLITMTFPHIGNTGVNDDDNESGRIWASGLIVKEVSRISSNWRSQRSLEEELIAQGIVGIAGIDTRALTRHLRDRGVMRAVISSIDTDIDALLARVRDSAPMIGANLIGEVTTDKPYSVVADDARFHVAALDFGIKRNTPRLMAERGITTHVLPADSTVDDIMSYHVDAVFLSNGPGDPSTAIHQVNVTRELLKRQVPVFGICFGNQILGQALGLSTYKLKYGHRGTNQPVRDELTGAVEVTSHNHGFALEAPIGVIFDTPYGRAQVSHICLNDNVVEGVTCLDTPAFSVQYHPEAAAGPHDSDYLFDRLTELMGAVHNA